MTRLPAVVIRERGQVVTRIGVALCAPAEFIDVRVVHDAGGVTVSTEE